MKNKPKKRNRFLSFIAAVLLIFLFCTILLSTALVLYATKEIDAELDLDLLIAGQGRTTKLYCFDETGEPVELEDQRLHGTENRIWIGLSDIPEDVRNAFIAIEDHRFYEHHGVDLRRTAGAVLSFLSPGAGDYGGSTITQQLVKNLTGDNAVTVKRKITEIMRALELEKEISKEEILEIYLNTVYLSEGCYGLETASEKYFSKPASELTLREGATLAAIIQYPTRYDPVQNPEYNRERRDIVLWRMLELGMIDEAEYTEATAAETELHLTEVQKQAGKNSWFTEVVIEDVINDLAAKFGLTRAAASQMIYNGGLSIYTTMDRRMQAFVEEFYANEENFPANTDGMRATSAAVIIDPENGHLLAVAGDTGEKKSDRILNLATQMLRSPGSVIKPITVYAPALERDLITWASVFDDVPVQFTKNDDGYAMWPKNNPRVYSGLTTVNTALAKSTNTVAVRVLQTLGIRTAFDFAKTVGLSTLVENEKAEDGEILSDMALAPLALGAVTRGVSVRDMTGAYSALANEGVYHKTISYTEVYDKDGKLLLSQEEEGRRVLSEETADIMTRLLQNVVSSGTASALTLQKSVQVAGKTGTSNADTDRWFIGYTPDILCGVWYGYKDAHDIGTFKTNPAVTIFDDLVTSLYAREASEVVTLDKTREFPQSENVVGCLYCKDSGEIPSVACTHDPRGHRIELGYFKKGTEPASSCDVHTLVDYDSKTHAVACDKCPKENLVKTALLKIYDRRFPCRVTVTDAQYVYRYLPFGEAPTLEENQAFFQGAYEKDCYIGNSNTNSAYNRYCAEHENPPETTEETTLPETTGRLPFESGGRQPSETTAPSTGTTEAKKSTPSETTGKKKEPDKPRRRVPWWKK